MHSRSKSRHFVQRMKPKEYVVLSDAEIFNIHEASLKILEKTGIMVYSRKVLDLLANSGMDVNLQKRRVRIPASFIEHALKSTPSKIALYDRNKRSALALGSGNRYLASGHNAIYVLEGRKSERRLATKRDANDFAKLADALENISIVAPEVTPQDVMPKSSLLHGVDAVFNNSQKHLHFAPERTEDTLAIFDMARAVAGEEDLSQRPILTCQLSSTSPLTWTKGAVEALIETAKAGVPCCLLPQPYAGVTAPITLAGVLVTNNVEVLSGIVLSQLIREGSPVIYGSAWSTFDMREGNVLMGSPETVLLRIAGAQMAKFYNIPYLTSGSDSDSHCLDEQNALEKVMTLLGGLISRTDVTINLGMFAAGLTVSFEQLVLDNEMGGMLLRLVRGICICPETIATDLIEKVGPRGQFITEQHTLERLRTGEHWETRVFNRSSYENWQKAGSPDVVERARKTAEEIIQSHQPEKLNASVQVELEEIIKDFERAASCNK